MNNPLQTFIWCAPRLTRLARVCLAPAKTRFEAAWQCRHQGKPIAADLDRRPLAYPLLTQRHARRDCIMLQSP